MTYGLCVAFVLVMHSGAAPMISQKSRSVSISSHGDLTDIPNTVTAKANLYHDTGEVADEKTKLMRTKKTTMLHHDTSNVADEKPKLMRTRSDALPYGTDKVGDNTETTVHHDTGKIADGKPKLMRTRSDALLHGTGKVGDNTETAVNKEGGYLVNGVDTKNMSARVNIDSRSLLSKRQLVNQPDGGDDCSDNEKKRVHDVGYLYKGFGKVYEKHKGCPTKRKHCIKPNYLKCRMVYDVCEFAVEEIGAKCLQDVENHLCAREEYERVRKHLGVKIITINIHRHLGFLYHFKLT